MGERFEPPACVTSSFTLEFSREIRHGEDFVLFNNCCFASGKNRGALSIKNSTNISFKNCTFNSGTEVCIEMSRVKNIFFYDCSFELIGNRQIAINCSSNSIKFSGCSFSHKGKIGDQAMALGFWREEEKVWRPPVSSVMIEGCTFSEGLVPYFALRSARPDIEGRSVRPWLVDLVWYIARKVLRKRVGVDYNIYEHEQM